MRLIKIALYALLVIVLQTVVFARINIFGAMPDLVLVSVVIFAVLKENNRAVVFAAGLAFMQDVFSYGAYTHTILKILVASLVGVFKENFSGGELSMSAVFVAGLTPLALLTEALIFGLFLGREIDPLFLARTALLTTLYNLALVPVLLPLLRKIAHA